MQISKVSSIPTIHNNLGNIKLNSKHTNSKQISSDNIANLPYYNDIIAPDSPKSIVFNGKIVHIVDGGNHATNMQHFAKAISKDMDTVMHNVDIIHNNSLLKQLRSLEQQLKILNTRSSLRGEYVAIPALASVPILNLQDQYNAVMRENKKFTPENLKSNKAKLLEFLKDIYAYRSIYSKYIGYMDVSGQGIENTYGVIEQINKLVEKGANVYVPSGHPQDSTLKWLAGERGLKPELYHYIAKGYDVGNCIHDMSEEIRRNNWYDFNLLSLSEANIVGVKESKGAQDYMFAAYDSCVTDGMRGVYNFSPVRQNGKLIGYSYTDTTTNEYPYNEFPANHEITNLVKFVGKPYYDVIASHNETEELKRAKQYGRNTQNCADKLYPVDDVFTQDEIQSKKIYLKGKYTDKTLATFFDTNSAGQIIFPNCDCEGSGKPSVISMWGSCFSVFNAIARDIELAKTANHCLTQSQHTIELNRLKESALKYQKVNNLQKAEDTLNYAINSDKAFSINNSGYFLDYEPHYLLGNLHFDKMKYDYAADCYNNAIDILAKYIKGCKQTDLYSIRDNYNKYIESEKSSEAYDKAIGAYYKKSAFAQFFSQYPTQPDNYHEYVKYVSDYELYKSVMQMSEMFSKLATICASKNETYPAKVCKAMADDIQACNSRGNRVINLRSQGVKYLGDLYTEIRKD